ncbi:MAG: NACHT domain-containing protein, partial [Synechocystis sp.]
CRIADQKYYFNHFHYVELADCDAGQIEHFVRAWFQAINDHDPETQAEEFLEQLERRENLPIRELVRTPILLNLVCSVFKERSAFPNKRSLLYQSGLEILLSRWDQARGIKRDQIYSQLPLPQKISLLSQIATSNFEREKYFFEKMDVLQTIADFLQELQETPLDSETLWFNSEAVLKSIEVQHGLLVETAKDIYCFSHLTFQEYLTARKICINTNNTVLAKLAAHITDAHWREVILLSVSMLPQTDFLYQKMQEEVAQLLRGDQDLQQFLGGIAAKEQQIDSDYDGAAVRAFYFGLIQCHSFDLAIALDHRFSGNLSEALTLDLSLLRLLGIALSLTKRPDIKEILNFNFALDIEHLLPEDPSLRNNFATLKQELPDLEIGKAALLSWWQREGGGWIENFLNWLETYRHLPVNFSFSSQQKQLLKRYYEANCLLMECLQSDGQVQAAVREAITAGLLLPDGELVYSGYGI